ncbi:MAG: NAD(P)/FAD-dependent oxidoreductase [Porticoccaceae bacterium]
MSNASTASVSTATPRTASGAAPQYDAVVIGAGVSGLYQIYRLREAGFSVLGIEAGSGVGGTWYWNRYPGARFDSESYTYAYSFSEELLQEWNWSEHFAPQPETLAYLNHVADKFNLRPLIRFNTRVTAATFDAGAQCWDIVTEAGATIRTRFMVMATGLLSATQFPDIPGIDSFQGKSLHTSRWPHDPNGLGGDKSVYHGKRVGIIGTGATAVQLIPHLAAGAASLHVFQRTANWCAPLHNGPIKPEEQAPLKASYPAIFKLCDKTGGAFMHEFDPRSIFDVSAAEREARFEHLYQNGRGFALWLANFHDVMTDMRANKLLSDFVARKIRARVKDPAIAAKLVPTTHGFGQRRVPMETNYYEVYNQDNVTLVDIRENPIARITPTGIKTTTAEYELDIIIFATGFDAGTGAISRIDIRGPDGRSIKDKWSRELKTFMGLQVSGFPNMFMHIGPHAAFCNLPRCAQITVDWVTDLMDYMRERNLREVVPTPEAETAWTRHAEEEADKTLLSKTDSWIMGSNIPGKPRALLLYAGPAPVFRKKCREVAESHYQGMRLS